VHWGTVTLVNSSGIGVRLDDTGIEGFVLLKQKEKGKSADTAPSKPVFDARRLSLSTPERIYRLDEPVAVVVADVDIEARRVSLELVDEETAARLSVWAQA
jgi:exoribonuclease-2